MQISETYEYLYRNMKRCMRYYESCPDKQCYSCEGWLVRARWWGSRLPMSSGCGGIDESKFE